MLPKPDNTNITAVIPTHNRLLELDRCIKSIYPYVKDIIVIDNNSHESIQVLEKQYEKVHVYSFSYNMGPAAAQNFGIKQSETPYILLLDNDTELVQWGEIFPIWECIAIYSFRIQEDKYFHMYSNYPDRPDAIQEIPWFYGCACLVNKKAWEQVGGYNEDYFAYYQECDISAKFWKSGFYIYYNPSIIFKHYDSTVERENKKISYWKLRNCIWFAEQHLPFFIGVYQILKESFGSITKGRILYIAYIDALKQMPKRDPIYDEFFLKVWRK